MFFKTRRGRFAGKVLTIITTIIYMASGSAVGMRPRNKAKDSIIFKNSNVPIVQQNQVTAEIRDRNVIEVRILEKRLKFVSKTFTNAKEFCENLDHMFNSIPEVIEYDNKLDEKTKEAILQSAEVALKGLLDKGYLKNINSFLVKDKKSEEEYDKVFKGKKFTMRSPNVSIEITAHINKKDVYTRKQGLQAENLIYRVLPSDNTSTENSFTVDLSYNGKSKHFEVRGFSDFKDSENRKFGNIKEIYENVYKCINTLWVDVTKWLTGSPKLNSNELLQICNIVERTAITIVKSYGELDKCGIKDFTDTVNVIKLRKKVEKIKADLARRNEELVRDSKRIMHTWEELKKEGKGLKKTPDNKAIKEFKTKKSSFEEEKYRLDRKIIAFRDDKEKLRKKTCRFIYAINSLEKTNVSSNNNNNNMININNNNININSSNNNYNSSANMDDKYIDNMSNLKINEEFRMNSLESFMSNADL